MKKLALIAASVILLAGCSATKPSITSLNEANKALETAGFDCSNSSPGTMDGIAWIQCETEGIDGAVTLGFSPTREMFLDSWGLPCENAVDNPGAEDPILIGETWVLVLSGEQLIFQNLDDVRSALGGTITNTADFCMSLE